MANGRWKNARIHPCLPFTIFHFPFRPIFFSGLPVPVRKFRSVQEMRRPVWREAGDPELFRTMAALWDLGV